MKHSESECSSFSLKKITSKNHNNKYLLRIGLYYRGLLYKSDTSGLQTLSKLTGN